MRTLAREVLESHQLTVRKVSLASGVDTRIVKRHLEGLEVQWAHARSVDAVLIDVLRGSNIGIEALEAGHRDLSEALREERAVNRMLEDENKRLREFARGALRAVAA